MTSNIQYNDIQTTYLIFKVFIHVLLAKLVVFIDINFKVFFLSK